MLNKLVTYDAICKTVRDRDYRWEFRDTELLSHSWEMLNSSQLSGTIMLIPPVDNLHRHVAAMEIYLLRWSDNQFTLERIF